MEKEWKTQNIKSTKFVLAWFNFFSKQTFRSYISPERKGERLCVVFLLAQELDNHLLSNLTISAWFDSIEQRKRSPVISYFVFFFYLFIGLFVIHYLTFYFSSCINCIALHSNFFLYNMVIENESPAVRLRRKLTALSDEYSKDKQIHPRSKSVNSRAPVPSDPNASLRYRRMRRKVFSTWEEESFRHFFSFLLGWRSAYSDWCCTTW